MSGRAAVLWTRRTQVCYDVIIASVVAAAGLTVAGAGAALDRLTSLAAIAQSATQVVRPGVLNLIGPILVLLALPSHRGGIRAPVAAHDADPSAGASGRSVRPPSGPAEPPVLIEAIAPHMLTRRGLRWTLATGIDPARIVRFSYRDAYWPRIVLTIAAWIAALALLVLSLTSLGDGYAVSSGTFLLGMLELAGLIAALAMWPAGLARALVVGQPTQRSSWASRVGTR